MADNIWQETTSSGLWSTSTSWSLGVPVNGSTVLFTSTSVANCTCDITPVPATGNLTSLVQNSAYTGQLAIQANKGIVTTVFDISGKVSLGGAGSSVTISGGAAADRKVYIRSGAQFTGNGIFNHCNLNLFSDAKVMEISGSVSGVTIIFFINSATDPLQAQDYSGFTKCYFLDNGSSFPRTIVFQGGNHQYGETLIETDGSFAGQLFTLNAGTYNPNITFLENVTVLKAAGSTIGFSLGSGIITFKKSADLSQTGVYGSGTLIFDGTVAQNIAFSTTTVANYVKFRNTSGGVILASGQTMLGLDTEMDGKFELSGSYAAYSAFKMTANAVFSGAGDLTFGPITLGLLLGSSTFTGTTSAIVESSDKPFSTSNVLFPAQDYSTKLPNITFQNTSDEVNFDGSNLFGAGNYTFGKLSILNGIDCQMKTTYNWATNNPNVTINDDFTVDIQNGSVLVQFGTGVLTLKNSVSMTGVDAYTSAGETVLGLSGLQNNITFGGFNPHNLTVDADLEAPKILTEALNFNTLKITNGWLKLKREVHTIINDFQGTSGILQSDRNGSTAFLDVTNKSSCSNISFRDIQCQAANMINAKNGGIRLSGNTSGIVFKDSFGEF